MDLLNITLGHIYGSRF